VRNQPEGVVQVWETSIDGTIGWPLIELPIRYPAVALPAQELAILEHDLCSTEQDHCPVEDVHLVYGLSDLRLSPNKQLLAWGDGASWCPNTRCLRHGLFVVDLATGDIAEVEVPANELLDYTQPHWSPDGRLIGVNTRRNGEGFVSGLAIFDPKDQTLRANLTVERHFPEWSWSNTGGVILVRLGSSTSALPPFTPQRIGIFHWMKGTLEQVSLPAHVEAGLDNWQLYLGEAVW
jgi:hypothetical protein